MATEERICIVFKPAAGKNAGDVSRQFLRIEAIIRTAGGYDFGVHPHDNAAFCFTLTGDATPLQAEGLVQTLNRLTDDDGHPVVDAEQAGIMVLQAGHADFDTYGRAAPG